MFYVLLYLSKKTYIYQQINEDKKRFGEERFLEIGYERLCKDVGLEMNRVAQFVNVHGLVLKRKQELPRQFEVSKTSHLSADDYNRIVGRVAERWDHPSGATLSDFTSRLLTSR